MTEIVKAWAAGGGGRRVHVANDNDLMQCVDGPCIPEDLEEMSHKQCPMQSKNGLMMLLNGADKPVFQNIWNDEFLTNSYNSNAIRAISCIGTFLYIYIFVSGVFFGYDGAGGGNFWVVITWLPNPICSIMFLLTGIVFSIQMARPFCMRNYNFICSVAIVSAYSAVISSYLILEIRRAWYQNMEYMHVIWGVNFSSPFPVRTCYDMNPVATVRANIDNSLLTGRGLSLGCDNLIISGGIYSFYVFLNMFPMVFNMSSRSAAGIAFVNSTILLSSLIAVGTKGGVVAFTILFQFLCGMLAAFFCHARTRFEKQQFAVAKATAVAAEQNSNLLYTLIPRNVVEQLSSHEPHKLLGTTISHCTVMFCSLEPQSEIQASFSEPIFDLLNDVFTAFDRAVKRFGMFKYQHVGDWYIVACPRAAVPFNGDEQAQPYPRRHTLAMLRLGEELRRIASGFTLQEAKPLWLKVGLNCGPVAGAVIGTHRSFYCLYGDVVNTAARMCKYGGARHIHCSGEFSAALADALTDSMAVRSCLGAAQVRAESRGFREVKGKGKIETFDVVIEYGSVGVASPMTGRPRASLWLSRPTPHVLAATLSSSHSVSSRRLGPFGREARMSVCSDGGSDSDEEMEDPPLPARVEDPDYRLSPVLVTFSDSQHEISFLDDTVQERRKGLLAAIALHVGIVVCHVYMVAVPEYAYDYSLLGDAQLAQGQHDAMLVLYVHLASTCAASAGLAAAALRDPVPTKVCEWGLVAMKLLHVACSVACHAVYPVDIGWMVMFTVDMAFLQAIAGLGFAPAASLVAGTFVELVVSIGVLEGMMVFVVAKAIAYAVCAVALAYIGQRSHRLQWQWNNSLESELGRLSDKLCDLLPPLIASRLLTVSPSGKNKKFATRAAAVVPSRRACEICTAVVLQLDICGFTSMSQTLEPIALAGIVHELFSTFDRAVQDRGLFKMDTIGDAYIVAGFTSTDAGSAAAEFSQSATSPDFSTSSYGQRGRAAMRCVCEEVLDVGGIMLRSIENYRRESGRDIHCRIGVSAGQVVAGVLGRLQPRFHIFGEGLRSAEEHEQTGRVDTVHASPAFVAALRASAAAGRGRSRSISFDVTTTLPGDSQAPGSLQPSSPLMKATAAAELHSAGVEREFPSSAVSKAVLTPQPESPMAPGPAELSDTQPDRSLPAFGPGRSASDAYTDTSRASSVGGGLWLPVGWLCEPGPGNGYSLVPDSGTIGITASSQFQPKVMSRRRSSLRNWV